MAPINAVVLVKTWTSKITSVFTNRLKRKLKQSPAFKPRAFGEYDELPIRLKVGKISHIRDFGSNYFKNNFENILFCYSFQNEFSLTKQLYRLSPAKYMYNKN